MKASTPGKRTCLMYLLVISAALVMSVVVVYISYDNMIHPCRNKPQSLRNPPLPPGAEQVAAGTPNIKYPEKNFEAKEIHFETTAKPKDVFKFYKETLLPRDGWSNEQAYAEGTELLAGAQNPTVANATFNWGCGFEGRSIFAIHNLYAQTLASGRTSVSISYEYVP